MKAFFLGCLLLVLSSAARADSVDVFQVSEQTAFGTILFSNAPPTDYVDWIIFGPINGTPADNFFLDEPLLFQLLGITLPTSGPEFLSLTRGLCSETGCAAWRLELQFPTDLPPGINAFSTVTVRTPTPEPASLLFLGCGMLAFGVWRKVRSGRAVH